MTLKNKIAIVTGGKQGIGLGIVKSLSKEGAKIIIADMDENGANEALEIIKNEGGEGIAVKCDVTKIEDVKNLFEKTITTFGEVNILVNNAGIYPFVSFEKMTESDWDKVMTVNLKSIFFMCSEAVKIMKNGSRIINISSIASIQGFEGLTHYCTSKGGITAFTRALALELAPKNITVNAVAPGAIDTPGATTGADENTKAATISNVPIKRYGLPEDIGNTVAFLAKDESSYITGQMLVVDGGWSIK